MMAAPVTEADWDNWREPVSDKPITEADWDAWVLQQPDARKRFWYLHFLASSRNIKAVCR